MFGDWGALLMQFLITAVVILGLAALVYWLVRRYSAAGLGRIGRGRVPRLAIIDAMSVDGRRRLVLVRRDNIEHLILIGGPSDIVVEQAIQRPRQSKTAAAAGDSEPALPQPSPPPKEVRSAAAIPSASSFTQSRPQPIGSPNGAYGESDSPERIFSFRRSPPPQPANQPAATPPRGETHSPAPSAARFVDLQRPTRIETAASSPKEPEPDSEPLFPELPTADLPPLADEVPAPPPAANGGGRAAHLASADARPAAETPRSLYAKPDPAGGTTGGNLADLENEMARLLGEITQKRTS